jgi:exodeoxyribonuclease V alpha subunit
MLDINLTASLLKAVPPRSQVLFIGDADQLPSVGAGNVLRDMIAAANVPCFRLTKIFRQAQESLIIRYAHQINNGEMPYIDSPFKKPEIWQNTADCLFLDCDEATQQQLSFIARVKKYHELKTAEPDSNPYEFRVNEPLIPYETEFAIPKKFQHVDLEKISKAQTRVDELLAVLKKVHPWSALYYGLSATEVVKKLYLGHSQLKQDDPGICQSATKRETPAASRRENLQGRRPGHSSPKQL